MEDVRKGTPQLRARLPRIFRDLSSNPPKVNRSLLHAVCVGFSMYYKRECSKRKQNRQSLARGFLEIDIKLKNSIGCDNKWGHFLGYQ